jgi:ribosomal protein L16 Arg81 hydroxylase
LYSRKHISRWLQEDYEDTEEKPLECIQEAGDVVYVPFDWGHAVKNEAEQTFGYALEVLNRREVFASLPSLYQSCK